MMSSIVSIGQLICTGKLYARSMPSYFLIISTMPRITCGCMFSFCLGHGMMMGCQCVPLFQTFAK